MRRALLALALLAAGCSRPQVRLTLGFALGDAGVGECLPANDLACVNYIRFQLSSEDLFTRCVRVDQRLGTLCDLEQLANGSELFRGSPDDVVSIAIEGLRVFPATSCEQTSECRPRTIFSGGTGPVKLGDAAGGSVPLTITKYTPCGPREEFRQRAPGQSCDVVCDTDRGNVPICELEDGCLCAVVSVVVDAGVIPDGGGADDAGAPLEAGSAPVDAGPGPVDDAAVDAAEPDAATIDAAAPDA